MTDADKQRAYEERRSKSRPAAMATVPTTHKTIEYRVWLRNGTKLTDRAIGPSQLFAHHPDMIGFWEVQEPKPGMMMEFW